MQIAPHILFPVDFSDRCRAVRPNVLSMAQHFRARVTLMHVIQIPAGWYGGAEQAYPIMLDVPAMIDDGRQLLAAFFEPSPPLEVETVVDSGDPAASIVGYAEQHGVGMIMMPTHGYGKFRSLLLGSVTAKVLHDTKCAVWTSAHTEDPKLAGRTQFKNILCAIDLSPESSGVICYAASLARSFKAQLQLVHAVTFGETRAQEFVDTEFSRGLFQMSRDQIVERQKEAGTDAPVFLEVGSVSSVVSRAAKQYDAGLMVIGRGRLHATLGRLRTNAYAIIRDSPCPVISA
jgi:nucleotide-binding universal stress UspA family protein